MNKPKKWHEVYPYGSKAGDEEAKVFRSLSRHSKFDWRSTGAIVKATGLTRERVEEIVDKYVNKVQPPLIYAHPSNEDHWGYWERVPEVLKKDDRGVSKKDKDNRVDKQIAGADMIVDADLYPSDDNTTLDDFPTQVTSRHNSVLKNFIPSSFISSSTVDWSSMTKEERDFWKEIGYDVPEYNNPYIDHPTLEA